MSRQPTRGRPTRKAVVRRKKKASIIDRVMARIPLSHGALHRLAMWTIVIVAVGGVYVAGAVTGVNAKVGYALAEQAGKAGLRVDTIQPIGVKRMNTMIVYNCYKDQFAKPMLAVDTEEVRKCLLFYGWVKDAQVSLRLPNLVIVKITERTPAAVWQDENNVLSLIDADGIYLEPVSADAMPDLPLVVGPGADKKEPAYQELMQSAPALKSKVRAARWVGNRRWDLQFDSGEWLMLPEEGATDALKAFIDRDRRTPLLGHGLAKIDMRNFPQPMTIRKAVPGEDSSGPMPIAKPTADKSDRARLRDPV